MANAIAPGVAGAAAGFAAGQAAKAAGSWEGRLREAAYKSPKGTRLRFEYEDVAREFDLRTTAFDFPGVSNSYVQQNGVGSRRYPLRCIFWGAQCDLIATAFEAALLEEGIGTLEHPLYGAVNVVPFGTVTRRDDLKSSANQAIVEVVFWTTTGAVYPSASGDARSEILAALDGLTDASALQFSQAMNLRGALNKANAISSIKRLLKQVSAALAAVSDSVAAARREFADLQRDVNEGIDVLIGQPLLLARQIVNLVRAPARALAGIQSRLDGYARLAASIFESASAAPAELSEVATLRERLSNDFHVADLFAAAAVSGTLLASAGAQPRANSQAAATDSVANDAAFSTRSQALTAAEACLAQLDAMTAWRDGRFGELGQVDTGDTYQALRRAAALAAGFLVQASFSLLPERALVLDRPRTIVDLAAELYGAVDSRLDLLIRTNALTGSEILELPRGRRIVFYPNVRT